MKKFWIVILSLFAMLLLATPMTAVAGALTDQQKVDRFEVLLEEYKTGNQPKELLTTLIVVAHEAKPKAKPFELKFGFGNPKDDQLVIELLREEARIAQVFGKLTIEKHNAGTLIEEEYLQHEKYASRAKMLSYLVGDDESSNEATNIVYALGYIETVEHWADHSWRAKLFGRKTDFSPSMFKVVTPVGELKLGSFRQMMDTPASLSAANLVRQAAYNK